MTTFTIHAEDALAEALRDAAREAGTSISLFVKKTMRTALGLVKARRKDPSFMRFAGRLSRADADALCEFVDHADFLRVDEGEWR